MIESSGSAPAAGAGSETPGTGWPGAKAVAAAAAALTVAGILIVHPHGIIAFAWYYCLWLGVMYVLHREELQDFALAFVVNSAFVAVYFLVQIRIFPESYGTTSPLGAQTDDSYFFSMVADAIPTYLEVRDGYFLYSHPFTSLVRSVTLHVIDHPMDAIFFQSGVAAMLATFSKLLMFQLSSSERLARTVFVFAVTCPFLMMNGGVIFIRDTFTAALFAYSLTCFNDRRFVLAAVAMALQMTLRLGTALMLLPAYAVIYWEELASFARRHWKLVGAATLALVAWAIRLLQSDLDLTDLLVGTSEGGGLNIVGREIFEGLIANPGSNVLLLKIQEQPFAIKLLLNAGYIFLYPSLSPKEAFAGPLLDVRGVVLNLFVPIYAFWLNAWFIAGAVSKALVTRKQREIVVAFFVTLILIGTYSLQTRHKTILYPLYYFVVAIGFVGAPPEARRIGYLASGLLMAFQLVMMSR